MFKIPATTRPSATRRPPSRRLTTPIVAIALVMAATGSAAASPLERDFGDGQGAYVTPTAAPLVDKSDWIGAKLHTTAGYAVLVFE